MLLQQDDTSRYYSVIGLLDIYGFEVFQNNRYNINISSIYPMAF